mmetsp:Transcript_7/g.20  ORF Transcript_7/g.20 Transcript_7/m.20 type:complete len:85 (+) Transcript_7:1157-1411(+)
MGALVDASLHVVTALRKFLVRNPSGVLSSLELPYERNSEADLLAASFQVAFFLKEGVGGVWIDEEGQRSRLQLGERLQPWIETC